MINLAIDQVIDGTDPRLRAISGYRKRLRPAVVKAVNCAMQLVDGLSPPIELSRRSFSREDCIRAIFTSSDHISDFLSRCQVLHDYLKKQTTVAIDNVHALLLVTRDERNVLGMELDEGIIRRDVPQVSINFTHPRLISPMNSESASRKDTNKQVFDYYIVMAMKKLLALPQKQGRDHHQHEILAKKLKTLVAANWSLEGLLNHEQEHFIDSKKLNGVLTSLTSEQEESESESVSLAQYQKVVVDTLFAAPDLLRRTSIKINMDRMGKKLDDEVGSSGLSFAVDELCSYDGRRLTAVPVYIPFTEIPPRPDFLTEASRYL